MATITGVPGAIVLSVTGPDGGSPPTATVINEMVETLLDNDAELQDYVDTLGERTIVFEKGITVTQSTSNGDGVSTTGNGSGKGISAAGGSGGGSGGVFVGGSSNGRGIECTGNGTAFGASISGGTNGPGAQISAGGGNNNGLDCYATGSGYAIRCQTGAIQLNGTQPAYNADPGANVLHSTNVIKAWGGISTDGSGGYSISADSINVASCTVTSTYIDVTWARAFSSANYAPVVTAEYTGSVFAVAAIEKGSQTTTKTRIRFRDLIGGSAIDPSATSIFFSVSVCGRH